MMDIHCIIRDREIQRNVALANNFKGEQGKKWSEATNVARSGPLFPNQTPPHVVRAYITRQMDRIRRSDLAQVRRREGDGSEREREILFRLILGTMISLIVSSSGNYSRRLCNSME